MTTMFLWRTEVLFLNKPRGVRIPSIDAKDLYLSNHYITPQPGGYNLRNRNGEMNLNRFINTLDYSLDLIKLREVYEKAYRRTDLTFSINGYEYTHRVINVTFHYSEKEYNRVGPGLYIKSGYSSADIELVDCLDVRDGELVAIKVGEEPESPAAPDVLGNYFYFEDGIYKAKSNIKAIRSVRDLRTELYRNGFYCDGIHYIRWKRSSGSARVGKCLFIDEKLYKRMHRWETCGIKVKDGQAIDLASFEAYISLTSSSIIDTLEIQPNNILVIDDYESEFSEDAVVTRAEDGVLVTAPEHTVIRNSIWDGQSLIDSELTSHYGNRGMLLLRNRFFKSCCFRCHIQDWFINNGIYEVSQLKGWTLAQDISEIKLITTPSSIKYYKFGTLEEWLSELEPIFGIVKHDKPTHYFDGDLVQVHYQLLNTLHMSKDEVSALLKPSLDYIDAIRHDPAVLRFHIQYPEDHDYEPTSLASKNDIVYKMLGLNEDFAKTKLYTDFRYDLVRSLLKELRTGHVLVHGTYATLCGNPLEMLQAAIGKFKGESALGIGNIHCRKFEYGKTLIGSRSPHVTQGNIWLPVNVASEKIDRYFPFSEEIVSINSIGENVLMRLSGCDFDSDTSLLSDNEILINAARRHYNDFLVPTSAVEAKKVQRYYTPEQQADLDVKTSENLIGDIVNLSQELNSLLWDRLNNGEALEDVMPLYYDISQLDVMSGVEIDKAKKEFSVDNAAELRKLKKKYQRQDDDGRNVKPHFFGFLAKQKGYFDKDRKAYTPHLTTMDYVQRCVNSYCSKGIKAPDPTLAFSDVLDQGRYDSQRVNDHQISRIIGLVENLDKVAQAIYSMNDLDHNQAWKMQAVEAERQKCSDYIGNIKLDYNTTIRLLRIVERDEYRKIRRRLFHVLFGYPNTSFFSAIKLSSTKLPSIHRVKNGDFEFFGFQFVRRTQD